MRQAPRAKRCAWCERTVRRDYQQQEQVLATARSFVDLPKTSLVDAEDDLADFFLSQARYNCSERLLIPSSCPDCNTRWGAHSNHGWPGTKKIHKLRVRRLYFSAKSGIILLTITRGEAIE